MRATSRRIFFRRYTCITSKLGRTCLARWTFHLGDITDIAVTYAACRLLEVLLREAASVAPHSMLQEWFDCNNKNNDTEALLYNVAFT